MQAGNHRKTAVVTGFPGWLGNHLVQRLLNEGWQVRALVLPELRLPLEAPMKIGAKWGRRNQLRIVPGDVTQPETLEALFAHPVEVVFHCVGIIHPRSVADFYRINTDGTANLLKVSRGRAKRFVFISSNAAAGFSDRLGRPMKEADPPHPESPYGRSKLEAERIVTVRSGRELETVILRPSMYIGIEQPERMTKLMEMIKRGNVPVFGRGDNPRSLTVIENLVDAMLLSARHPKAVGQTFWIVSERPYTTVEFLQLIAKNIGVPFRPRHLPAWPAVLAERLDRLSSRLGVYNQTLHILGETAREIAASGEKAKKLLGYRPRLTVAEGIKQAVDWAKEHGLI